MNNFLAQFIGAAVVAIIGFVLVVQQAQWIQFIGIILMVGAVGIGFVGDLKAAASRQ